METIEELKSKIAVLEADKAALVGETTDSRTKNRLTIEEKDKQIGELKALLAKSAETSVGEIPESKIVEVVQKVLQTGEQQRASDNRVAALNRFVNENRDYHPDNDTGGLKRQALERELSGLTAWSTTVEVQDLMSVIGKAESYLRGTGTPRSNPGTVQVPSTPPTTTTPPVAPDTSISEEEQRLLDRTGMSKEHFIKLKAKQPEFIQSLLS